MPYTEKQVRYLLSNGSPLNAVQKEKMKGELHADPAMGHKKKGETPNIPRYRSALTVKNA
jgi:hypothetical protein